MSGQAPTTYTVYGTPISTRPNAHVLRLVAGRGRARQLLRHVGEGGRMASTYWHCSPAPAGSMPSRKCQEPGPAGGNGIHFVLTRLTGPGPDTITRHEGSMPPCVSARSARRARTRPERPRARSGEHRANPRPRTSCEVVRAMPPSARPDYARPVSRVPPGLEPENRGLRSEISRLHTRRGPSSFV